MIVRNEEGDKEAESYPQRDLKNGKDDEEIWIEARRDDAISDGDQPTADGIQNHRDIRHVAEAQHVSKEASDGKQAKSTGIQRP